MGIEMTLSEISSILQKEIVDLLEDEEVITQVQIIISLFRIIYEKKHPIIDPQIMTKAIVESLPEILEKVSEDRDSELKLIKELGKIAFCL